MTEAELDDKITQLEAEIRAARESLPYLDRGYFDAESRIKRKELTLAELKRTRDHAFA